VTPTSSFKFVSVYEIRFLRGKEHTRLKFIQSNSNQHRSELQCIIESFSCFGYPPLGEVVRDASFEANMGVDKDNAAEDGVHNGVVSTSDEWGDGEGDEGTCKNSGGWSVD
jgi:hypothetical protein